MTLTILLSHLDFRITTLWNYLTVLPHISPLVTIHLRRHGDLLTICIRRMVSMIELTKGPALLSNLFSIADIFCNQHQRGIRYTCYDNRTNSHYPSIVVSLLYRSVSIGWYYWRVWVWVCLISQTTSSNNTLHFSDFHRESVEYRMCCLTIVRKSVP